MNQPSIALVTGGSRGLGKDMALNLARKGHNVIITYHQNKELALQTVQELEKLQVKSLALELNLSDTKAIPTFVATFKTALQTHFQTTHFDCLINNAGMGATVPFEQVTEALFDEFLNVHFKSVYFLTQQCVPFMNNGGCIINISSGTTRYCNPGYSVYSSMKGALEVFTRYLAKELGHKGIRANVVAPGPVETDFNHAAIRNNPLMKERLSSLSPLGRVGVAEDIGSVVAFLCSEEARWINGQRIEVSGGINI
ncbi:SDR family oxidoreductase [Hydrotalea sp.]|uniref:SDR family NAD(P)-dependent oxidoreductase n=1 Tax=Hydrotalea sp. TaxID=2881279 RepID=UPI0026142FF6|nr:SDR family oxidoreductase [Hydrotalea sp.]